MMADMHVDIYDYIQYPEYLEMEKGPFDREMRRSVDIPSMEKAGVRIFFASVCPIDPNNYSYEKDPISSVEKTKEFLRKWGFHPYERREGYILHMEGMGWSKGYEDVKRVISLGVKSIGPFWEKENVFGDNKGLKETGYRLLKENIILDMAHAPEGVIRDVYETDRTFIVSHTGLKRFVDVERNISDRVIRWVGEVGGVIGIFVDKDWGAHTPYLLAKHYNHIKRIAGEESVGIGTDFLGLKWSELGTLKRYEDFEKVFKWLRYMGWSSEEVENLKWRNVVRIIDGVY